MTQTHFAVALSIIIAFAAACGSDESNDGADAGADMAINNAMTDAANNGAVEDGGGGEDAGTTDAGNDMGVDPADMGADTGTDASEEDAGASEGCAPGYTTLVGVDGVIVACEGAAESINQCDASEACGEGWHMCTASEFRAQYESTEPPGVLDANFWIASCIRDGDGPQSPSDQVCSDCTGTQTGPEADIAFSCVNSISIVTESSYVGVRAAGSCQFAGTGNPGNDAYWSASPASTLQAGAFCCPDL